MTNNNPVYIVLSGLPCSGKSTFAKELLKRSPLIAVISSDRFIENQAAYRRKTYDEVFADNIESATMAAEAVRKEAIRDLAWIVDDRTNLSSTSRMRRIEDLPVVYEKVVVFFEFPEEERLLRLRQRVGKSLPAEVNKRMFTQWVRPTSAEGFKRIYDASDPKNWSSVIEKII